MCNLPLVLARSRTLNSNFRILIIAYVRVTVRIPPLFEFNLIQILFKSRPLVSSHFDVLATDSDLHRLGHCTTKCDPDITFLIISI